MNHIYTSLSQIFEENVKLSPSTTAIIDNNTKLTYAELNHKANQAAHWLLKQGIHKGDTVALLFTPSIEFVIFLVAVTKLGAIYLPLDVKAPPKRIEHIIKDSKAKLTLTNQTGFNNLDSPTQIIPDTIWDHGKMLDNIQIDQSDPVCIFYTSGSTGHPKGVIVPHKAITNLVKQPNLVNIRTSQVIAQFSNIAFDAITFEIWGALLNQATILNIPAPIKQDYTKLEIFFNQNHVDYIFFPTAYFHQMISLYPGLFDKLHTILFGGEQVNVKLIRNFLNYRKSKNNPITLIHVYGPTETTTFACYNKIEFEKEQDDEQIASIGKNLENVKTYVLNENLVPVNLGEIGELYIAGVNLAIGYNNSTALNKEKFIKNCLDNIDQYKVLYKTGDKVKLLSDGNLLYVGRIDDLVKISGYRVYLHEIENQLIQHPNISSTIVMVENIDTIPSLTAYLTLKNNNIPTNSDQIRNFLSKFLPAYMLPSKYVQLEQMPLNNNGKIDKNKVLEMPQRALETINHNNYSNNVLNDLKAVFAKLLNRNNIEIDRNLFELGANSLIFTQAYFIIANELGYQIKLSDLFTYPSVYKLTKYIETPEVKPMAKITSINAGLDIAIVGMACRFPNANNVEQYWINLCEEKNCLTNFVEKDVWIADNKSNSYFVPVRGIVENINMFDASFFNFSPVDASIIDPQQRIFLECAWEALEFAGNTPEKNNTKSISIFAGMADSSYLQNNLLKSTWFNDNQNLFNARVATSIGTLSTQVSYRLNLNGKSININTACSTSLIAVEQACQDLLLGYSDIALAGGVSLDVSNMKGYHYQPGGIESKNGKCSPFDKDANGTVFSDGVGVVVLKRLADAVKDKDTIYAVIKGSGTNNDAADKVGYTAPSINGQVDCITKAVIQSGISVEDIGFIEGHGTATEIGDVIEFQALDKAFKQFTDKTNYCVLGSVKGNIGHTDIAAGMAGLIKTVLSLYYRKIPPTLNFKQANQNINLSDSPFYINSKLLEWDSEKTRFAGVSAFGIGGTNAHLILSEYQQPHSQPSMQKNVLVNISAKTKKALDQNTSELINFLKTDKCTNIPNYLHDFAYTLQTGRDDFQYRKFVVGSTNQEIIDNLNHSLINSYNMGEQSPIVFMFSGQGSQYQGMAMQLFDSVEYFSSIVLDCARIANNYLGHDIISIIRNNGNNINKTEYTQPALFIIEYALAKLLMYYGVTPNALIGHSIGEYVAACLAQVFSLEDAIKLVCQRSLLMSKAPKGAMLSIECNFEDFTKLKDNILVDLAVHNSKNNCVASGTNEAISQLEHVLDEQHITYQRLKVSHSFHSYLMQDIANEFSNYFTEVTLSPPQIPIVSNLTGHLLQSHQATDPNYWVQHLLKTVQFKAGIETLVADGYKCFVEIGPGVSLCAFTSEIVNNINHQYCITNVLPNHKKLTSDNYQLFNAIGKLWQYGAKINWSAFYGEERRLHIPLPTYQFQKQKYWIEPDKDQLTNNIKKTDIAEWFYQPSWVRKANYEALIENPESIKNYTWIIFGSHKNKLIKAIINNLNRLNADLIIIEDSNKYIQINKNNYKICPAEKAHYFQAVTAIKEQVTKPILILHLYSYSEINQNKQILVNKNPNAFIDNGLNNSFYSLLFITQAFIEVLGPDYNFKCGIITNGSQQVLGHELINPINASLTGICRVVPQEHSSLKFKLIDLETNNKTKPVTLANTIISSCIEDEWDVHNPIVALRNNYIWQLEYTSIKLKANQTKLRNKGVYLLTGGLGGINLTLSDIIARTVSKPVFILLSRTNFPHESQWKATISDNKSIKLHSKIKSLKLLQSLGATIHIEKADITDLEALKSVIKKFSNYGDINGVIHAAGIAGGGLVQLKTKEMADKVFAPKLTGTYNLAKALKGHNLDFIVFCSSVSALIGEQGQVDYCAANACLDAFAVSGLFNTKNTISINWNTWQSVGMAVETERPEDITFLDRGNDISPLQGQQIFLNILENNFSQVAVSAYDINKFSYLIGNPNTSQDFLNISREDLNIDTGYVPPGNKTEEILVKLWQDILGIEKIGTEDDFFAIGGHSLKVLRLVEVIQKKLKNNISIKDIYENRTIRVLSQKLVGNKDYKQKNDILFPLKVLSNNLPIIFLFHPIAGNIFCYNDLVDNWDLPFSIYGVQDPSVSSGNLIYPTLLDMAKAYYQEIKQLQPHGPYYFLGYSFGGTVAYEVANLFKQANETINFLGMIDGWAVFSESQRNEVSFKQYIKQENAEFTKDMITLSWKRMQLLTKHKPSNNNIDIVLFKATELIKDYQDLMDSANGWKKFNHGNIKIYSINATHDTIIYGSNIVNIFNILQLLLR